MLGGSAGWATEHHGCIAAAAGLDSCRGEPARPGQGTPGSVPGAHVSTSISRLTYSKLSLHKMRDAQETLSEGQTSIGRHFNLDSTFI